jgi:hypothetical protein
MSGGLIQWPTVLLRQPLQALDLVGIEPSKLLAPCVDGWSAHPLSPDHFGHAVLICLSQDPNNLLVRKSPLLYSRLSLQKRPLSQASTGLKFVGQVMRNHDILAQELNSEKIYVMQGPPESEPIFFSSLIDINRPETSQLKLLVRLCFQVFDE